MRIFRCTTFLFVLAWIIPGTQTMQAQIDPVVLSEDATRRVVVSAMSTDGASWAQYCEIANYTASVAPTFIMGEIQLIHGSDTSLIGWDHPLAGKPWRTETVPVYLHNSLDFQNEIISKPFTMHEGDVVKYFRDISFRFPTEQEDGTPRTKTDHIAGASVPDTLVFRVELMDHATGAVLRSLHEATILPSANWNEFSLNMFRTALETKDGIDEQDFLCTLTADGSLLDRPLRIRIVPTSGPQHQGDFSTRALYVRYYMQPRLSLGFVQNSEFISSAVDAALDTARSIFASGKSAFDEQDVPKDASISITPSTIMQAAPVLSIRKSFIADESNFTLLLSDINGRFLHRISLSPTQTGQQSFQVRLPAEKLSSGYYIALLRSSHRYNYSIIRVLY